MNIKLGHVMSCHQVDSFALWLFLPQRARGS